MSISIPQARIINSCYFGPFPISCFFRRGYDYKLCFQETWHGLSNNECLGAMHDLCEKGLCSIFEHADIEIHTEPVKRIIPGVLYGLTPKGGKLWERIYNVLWNNYIRQEEEFDTELHYYSINEEAIREAAALIEKSGITSIENTIEKVTSWQVTNWKALENAWRLKIKKSKNPSPHEKEIMDRVRNFTSSFSENFKLEDPVI